jgi:hypothetical protein
VVPALVVTMTGSGSSRWAPLRWAAAGTGNRQASTAARTDAVVAAREIERQRFFIDGRCVAILRIDEPARKRQFARHSGGGQSAAYDAAIEHPEKVGLPHTRLHEIV